jgi:hypothetical protein
MEKYQKGAEMIELPTALLLEYNKSPTVAADLSEQTPTALRFDKRQ